MQKILNWRIQIVSCVAVTKAQSCLCFTPNCHPPVKSVTFISSLDWWYHYNNMIAEQLATSTGEPLSGTSSLYCLQCSPCLRSLREHNRRWIGVHRTEPVWLSGLRTSVLVAQIWYGTTTNILSCGTSMQYYRLQARRCRQLCSWFGRHRWRTHAEIAEYLRDHSISRDRRAGSCERLQVPIISTEPATDTHPR